MQSYISKSQGLRGPCSNTSYYDVMKVTGDHQGMLTRPSSIAHGILEAATAPL